ncbi:MAG: 30S ribosomal protein S21 [Candidatus Riesia sp.]|nr:30S ribosomal protein S21 [Candidatus Riesia sp.]
MPNVIVKDNEPIDLAIRRLKRSVERSGLPKELRRREFYEPPSKIKKRRISSSKKRLHKRLSRERLMVKRINRIKVF